MEQRKTKWVEKEVVEMRTVKVRDIEIGSGIPKICVPIVGKTREEILSGAARICESGMDLAEWRVDWYEEVEEIPKVLDTAEALRKIMGEIPLLFTFRTKEEGGEREITLRKYRELNEQIIKSGCVDLVDAELFCGEETVRAIIAAAHAYGVQVIMSNHDFVKTPPKEEIVSRLRGMQEMDADIAKIAVMPQCGEDVLTLLAATEEMHTQYAECPVITMSMGREGLISRLCGEVFGSAVTFGAVGQTSAPGQIEAGKLREMLRMLHEEMK